MPDLIRRNILQVKSPVANFNDRLLTLNQQTVSYEQGMSFNFIKALEGALDSSIKNYSSLYLTNAKLDTTIFDITDTRFNTPAIFTQIAHKDPKNPDDTYFFMFLPENNIKIYDFYNGIYVLNESTSKGDPTTTEKLGIFVRQKEDINSFNISDTIFEIELFPYDFCRIKHSYGGSNYYLYYDKSDSSKIRLYGDTLSATNDNPPSSKLSPLYFYFKKDNSDSGSYDSIKSLIEQNQIENISDSYTIFKYIINGDKLYLYKMRENYTSDNTNTYPYSSTGGIVTLSSSVNNRLSLSAMTLSPVMTALSSGKIVSSINYEISGICYSFLITDSRVDPILKLNTSWISYNISNIANGSINIDKSGFNLPSHSLLHFEYNSNIYPTIDVNILKLKTNVSDKNFIKRQSYMYNNDKPVIKMGDGEETENTITINPKVVDLTLLFTQLTTYSAEDINAGSVAIALQPDGIIQPDTFTAI